MKHGDLSNQVPPRLIVVLDYFTTIDGKDIQVRTNRALHRWKSVVPHYEVSATMLGLLTTFQHRYGVSLELVAVGVEPEELDTLVDYLDGRYSLPFRSHYVLRDLETLLREATSRTDILGICDRPERVGRYGSLYFSPTSVGSI